jgi:hypothetical protein
MHLGLVDRPFVPLIGIVPSFSSRCTPHAAREASISEGRKLNIRILPAARDELQLLGSFTCPKAGTWDRLFDFPSEGRHAEDCYIRKIRRLRPGLNPRTRELEASMLTSRPRKALCSELVRRVLATHSIRQFPLHFPSCAPPCAITFQLESTHRIGWNLKSDQTWRNEQFAPPGTETSPNTPNCSFHLPAPTGKGGFMAADTKRAKLNIFFLPFFKNRQA